MKTRGPRLTELSVGERKCRRCKKVKPTGQFRRRRTEDDGAAPSRVCNQCTRKSKVRVAIAVIAFGIAGCSTPPEAESAFDELCKELEGTDEECVE